MTQKKTARRTATAIRPALHRAALKTAALGLTSAQVIAQRTARAATGDHAEASRMVPEKLGAAAVSGMVAMQHTMRMSLHVAGFAMAETFRMARMAQTLAGATTPAAVFAAQFDFLQAWLPRWQGQAMQLGGAWGRSGSAVLAPVQRVVTGNARRLAAG